MWNWSQLIFIKARISYDCPYIILTFYLTISIIYGVKRPLVVYASSSTIKLNWYNEKKTNQGNWSRCLENVCYHFQLKASVIFSSNLKPKHPFWEKKMDHRSMNLFAKCISLRLKRTECRLIIYQEQDNLALR